MEETPRIVVYRTSIQRGTCCTFVRGSGVESYKLEGDVPDSEILKDYLEAPQ